MSDAVLAIGPVAPHRSGVVTTVGWFPASYFALIMGELGTWSGP
jgi:hypothetical protein